MGGNIYRGIITGLNEAFIIDEDTRKELIKKHRSSAEIIKPILRGRDVKRWTITFAKQYLIRIESSENVRHPWTNKSQKEAESLFAKTYPAVYKHLQNHREGLINRDDQGKYFWELRSCTYWNEFDKPKIIYPNICQRNEFTWDDKKYVTNQKAFIITDTSFYLLGILNSKLVYWLFDKLLAKLQGNFYEPSLLFMREFPVANISVEKQKPIETRVERVLAAKRANPQADTSKLESEIDRLIYQLYGLTEEEIAIVEGKA